MSFLHQIADVLHINYTQVFALFMLIMNHPLAAILHVMIRKDWLSPFTRHVYIILVGLVINYLHFGIYTLFPLLFALSGYFFVTRVKLFENASITILYTFTVLNIFQIYRFVTFDESDIFTTTSAIMMLTQKITLFAWYVEQRMKMIENNKEKVSPSEDYITIYDYLSYCFFFPIYLSTPANDYSHYCQSIRGFYVKKYKKENGYLPSVWLNTLSPLACCIITYGLYIVITSNISPRSLSLMETDSLAKFIKFYIFFLLYGFGRRSMFYGTWFLAESQCNLCFVGFGGMKDGKEDWSWYKNFDIWNLEFAQNTKMVFDNWNINTSRWLRRIVYDRVKSHKVIYTFLLSAFWHGVFPHYYHTFVFGAVMTYLGRIGHRKISPYLNSTSLKIGYTVFKMVITQFLISYHTFVHLTLDLRTSMIVWRKFLFCGHWVILGMIMKLMPESKIKIK